MKKSVVLLTGVSAVALAYAANAETLNPSIQSILSTMNAAGGSETLQWQVAPSYSDLFGLGVRTAVGGYVTEDFALGVIVDYAAHREEYLANAGVKLNENMRMIGSVGILKESEEFVLGEGREDVQQLEYGLSLKGDYEAGIVRGFEINAYHTNASSNTDTVETGDLVGIQAVTNLKPSDASNIRVGAGYERAEWHGGDVDEGITFQALGSQKLSDKLSLNFNAKSATTEGNYGLGLTYDMSTPDFQNSTVSINFDQIEGKHGISDDTRVAINWTVGLGGAGAATAGASDVTVSSMGSMPSVARKDLLAEVMSRPAFLPERVLASAAPSCNGVTVAPDWDNNPTAWFYVAASVEGSQPSIQFDLDSVGTPLPATITVTGVNGAEFVIPAEGGDATGRFYFLETGATNSRDPSLAAAFPLDSTVTLDLGTCSMDVIVTVFKDELVP